MRRVFRGLSIAALAAILTGCVGAQRSERAKMAFLPEAPDGYRWELMPQLSDEFDGDQLDADKWLDYHPWWDGRDPSVFDPGNVSVQDGMLNLVSTTDIDDLSTIDDPEEDIWVRAACVASRTPAASYGYYEARVKASRLSMTSSFWFQGDFSEIDVVEQLGAPVTYPSRSKYMLMNTHYFKDGWERDRKTPKFWTMPSGSADDFHVYGVWWKDKDTVWFYHNGEKVAEVTTGGEFTEPMHMFFDTEVFVWEGLPTIESLKDSASNTMLVDWVHAWKLVER